MVSAALVLLQMQFGSRNLYRFEIAPALSLPTGELYGWAWWFVIQGVLGLVVPLMILRFGFGQTWANMGLAAGDWKFAGSIALFYVPLVVVGTWILSDNPSFQENYPHLRAASRNWTTFLIYELLFLFYWIGWEYLWRGFVLFGTKQVLGVYAILVQALPFAVLHYAKPFPEAMLSLLGGIALGVLVWRSRSFWIAVPIHWLQMFLLDLFSTLRIRSGVAGWDPGAALEIIRQLTAS